MSDKKQPPYGTPEQFQASMDALAEVVEKHFDENKAALARKIGVEPMTVSHWFKRGIPWNRAEDLERACNGKISKEQFRPDIYSASAA